MFKKAVSFKLTYREIIPDVSGSILVTAGKITTNIRKKHCHYTVKLKLKQYVRRKAMITLTPLSLSGS